MFYDEVCKAVNSVRLQYDTRDPFLLCELLGIKLCLIPLGKGSNSLKGFYQECYGVQCIVINCDLPEVIQRVILAHELGHAILHRDLNRQFMDTGLFDVCGTAEKEANLFAAELLLDDEEVLELLNEGRAFSLVAAQLRVPAELLDFKLRLMQRKGYEIAPSPITARNGFLADIEVSRDADWYC